MRAGSGRVPSRRRWSPSWIFRPVVFRRRRGRIRMQLLRFEEGIMEQSPPLGLSSMRRSLGCAQDWRGAASRAVGIVRGTRRVGGVASRGDCPIPWVAQGEGYRAANLNSTLRHEGHASTSRGSIPSPSSAQFPNNKCQPPLVPPTRNCSVPMDCRMVPHARQASIGRPGGPGRWLSIVAPKRS